MPIAWHFSKYSNLVIFLRVQGRTASSDHDALDQAFQSLLSPVPECSYRHERGIGAAQAFVDPMDRAPFRPRTKLDHRLRDSYTVSFSSSWLGTDRLLSSELHTRFS